MSKKSFSRKDLDEDLTLFRGRIIPFVKDDDRQPWQRRKKRVRDGRENPPVYELPPHSKGMQALSRFNGLMKGFNPRIIEKTLLRPEKERQDHGSYKGRLEELEEIFKGQSASLTKKLTSLEQKIDTSEKEEKEEIQDVILSDALVHRLTQALFQKMKSSLKDKEEGIKPDNPFLRQGRIRIDIEL